MKKQVFFTFFAALLILTGCESTREITLNQDSSGTFVSTTDMGAMLGMAKMAGKDKDMSKVPVMDTSFSLEKMADSLEDLSAGDRALIRKGQLSIQLNMENDKCIIKMAFPFSNPSQIDKLDKLSSQLMLKTLKKQMDAAGGDQAEAGLPEGTELPEGSINDYYTTTYTKNVIEKKLIKEKYDKVDEDDSLKGLKEMAGMGGGNSTLIINLPRPATKVEGKNVTLSEDKKKVTIGCNAEDFFDDGASLEFRIEF